MRRRGRYASVLGQYLPSVGIFIAVFVAVLAANETVGGPDGIARALLVACISSVIGVAIVGVVIVRPYEKAMHRRRAADKEREAEFRADAERRQFERDLNVALEMSQSEEDALELTERALLTAVPDARAELLLASHVDGELRRVAVSAPDAASPGCPVRSTDECPAARTSQALRFGDAADIDACPKLRLRADGLDTSCRSATCVPVSIMGKTTGVVHVLHGARLPDDARTVSNLESIAQQVGQRVGMLRIMAETQLQASTDGLTGLLNRRSLESKLRVLRNDGTPFVFAMADLDHFKRLNDTHGHDAGDRALRLFADVTRSSLRPVDLACRYGGEEFAIVITDATVREAVRTLERLREHLALALHEGTVPPFTVSVGVAGSRRAEDLASLARRADAALYEAKEQGRNRVVAASDATVDAGREGVVTGS
ncbi:MAG: sensor domain-containing diguanylate cyclase [Acidimicrobiia bacterium]